MTRLIYTLALALTLLFGASPAHADTAANEKPPLVLGVFPYVTPVQLVAFHTPLKDYLAKQLNRPVTLVTAPDFVSFVDRTRDGQYDIVITAPHLGRLAETRDRFQRIAQTQHVVQGIFLARKDSDIRSMDDLKGKSVMMAQKVSIIYQMAENLMREKGLVPGQNIKIIETRTHNNAMYAPLRSEADASVTGTLLFRVLQDEQKEQLRVIGATEEAPGFTVMAHPRMPAQDVEAIRKLLVGFHRLPESKAYFETTGFQKFLPDDDRAMKRLDPYTRIFETPAAP